MTWPDNNIVNLAYNASSVLPLGKAKRHFQSEKKTYKLFSDVLSN